MRRLLQVLGGLTLVGLLVIGGGIAWLVHLALPLDRSSRAWVDRAVPAIIAPWNPRALFARSVPELRAEILPGAMEQLLAAFSHLGPMLAYQGAKGEANIAVSIGAGTNVTAAYVAQARFTAGTATIRISLVQLDGHWRIAGFFVHPVLTGPPLHRL